MLLAVVQASGIYGEAWEEQSSLELLNITDSDGHDGAMARLAQLGGLRPITDHISSRIR